MGLPAAADSLVPAAAESPSRRSGIPVPPQRLPVSPLPVPLLFFPRKKVSISDSKAPPFLAGLLFLNVHFQSALYPLRSTHAHAWCSWANVRLCIGFLSRLIIRLSPMALTTNTTLPRFSTAFMYIALPAAFFILISSPSIRHPIATLSRSRPHKSDA